MYDSVYGNTEEIADAMAQAIECDYEPVQNVTLGDVEEAEFIIVGSPTQAGRPTKALRNFLKQLPANSLRGKAVAVFDTRLAKKVHGLGLYMVMGAVGFAAPRIAQLLKSKGARLIGIPEGFIVDSKNGPLAPGELKRAEVWARNVSTSLVRR
jgi:flavodoxin